ncbi:MAG: 3-dehydroquinate dehydratase [Exilispira sp.]|jgi:3-dehydroquinate dehydratase-2|nr:3-dehydroquinate dehydratase [Exilispira sp.]
MSKKIVILNGPNFSHLHLREKEIYGQFSLEKLEEYIKNYSEKHYKGKIDLQFFQSNSEGQIIDFLLKNIDKYDALIINPAAYSHYSIAISDTLKILKLQDKIICEVHLSNIFARESERQNLITAKNVDILIAGAGIHSYILALEYIFEKLSL